MKTPTRIFVFVIALASTAAAQQAKPAGIVATADLKSIVPSSYFYRGESGSVQLRNSAAVRTKDGKYVLAGMVDTSGYASDIAAKYQGLFITEVKLKVGDSELGPGEYGFGFVGEKFVVTDVGANDVLSTASQRDDNLKRAVPLKITEDGGSYRLYAGKKYVILQME
jgi:subtilisin family serine protease